ncbi:hypothetical protein P7K49_017218 [Saguinus oedipus]|uniref:L-type lectin-like domain-containing protein n=1 Tax=Saguinus oedipus TaxID=9490 RepID=A0ABQ9V2C3_SAGOE|nr:hypothetical protein P7K49_017218 [Saguinus oedipus]
MLLCAQPRDTGPHKAESAVGSGQSLPLASHSEAVAASRGPGTYAILGLEKVRLAPSMRNRSGAVWSRASVLFSAWEVEVQMRVTGLGRRGAQGMVSVLSRT